MENITICTNINYNDKNYEIVKGEERRKEIIPVRNVKKVLQDKLLGFYLTQPEITVIAPGKEFNLLRENAHTFLEDNDENYLIQCTFLHQYKDSNLTYNFHIYFQEW